MATLAYFLGASRDSGDEATFESGQERVSVRDRMWLQEIAAGDERALEALYTAYYHKLRNFANTLVHSLPLTEEIVHDVFISLWQRRKTVEILRVQAYLYRAVRLRAIDMLRSARTAERADRAALIDDVLHAANPLVPAQETPEEQLIAAEIRQAVFRAIATLPPARATAARLRWIDDLSIAEIAEVMRISVPAAQMHVSRARQAVADTLKPFLLP